MDGIEEAENWLKQKTRRIMGGFFHAVGFGWIFFDQTINIFARKVALNEYANIGNPLIQNFFPLI